MRKILLSVLVIAVCTGQTCTPQPANNSGQGGTEELIFTNTNVSGVLNNPTAATTFTLNQAYTITKIRTYHYNNGQGTAAPGTISLQSSGGTSYGPWAATGEDGQPGVTNTYWNCTPNVELGAGTYTIVDSDNATWSRNSASGNAGIAWVYGVAAGGTVDDVDILALAKTKEEVAIQFDGTHNYNYGNGRFGDDMIGVSNTYGGTSGPWGAEILAPITWNGNTFTVNHQNSRTLPEGDVWTMNIQITGTLSADGRSISNWSALSVETSDQMLLGTNTTRSFLVGSALPVPYRDDGFTDRLVYEVTGPAVQNYLQTVEYYWTFIDETYISTDYNNAANPPVVFIMFSPRD